MNDDGDDDMLYDVHYAILEIKDQSQDINDILYILEKKCEEQGTENIQDNISLSYKKFQQLLQLARTVRYYQNQVLHSLKIIKSNICCAKHKK